MRSAILICEYMEERLLRVPNLTSIVLEGEASREGYFRVTCTGGFQIEIPLLLGTLNGHTAKLPWYVVLPSFLQSVYLFVGKSGQELKAAGIDRAAPLGELQWVDFEGNPIDYVAPSIKDFLEGKDLSAPPRGAKLRATFTFKRSPTV